MKINCYLKAGGGVFRNDGVVYPAIVDAGRIEAADFLDYVQRNGRVSATQSMAVLTTVAEELQKFLATGHSVEVPGFGTFSLDVKGKVTAGDDGKRVIDNARGVINFTPVGKLRNCLNDADFTLINQDVVPNVILDDEAALAIATKLLGETGYFLQKQFAEEANVSQGYASRVLANLVERGLLDYETAGRVKIYRRGPEAQTPAPQAE